FRPFKDKPRCKPTPSLSQPVAGSPVAGRRPRIAGPSPNKGTTTMQRRDFILSLPIALAAPTAAKPAEAARQASSKSDTVSDLATERSSYLAYKAAACKAALQENRPIMEKIIKTLWQLEDLCQEFFEETCAGCECTERPGWCAECEDVDALRYQVRMFTCM